MSEIHEMTEKLKAVCDIKERMTTALKTELDKGIETLSTKEAGEVADIIKDLAETEKYCMESLYYKTVICAMEEGKDPEWENDRMGYMPPKRGNWNRMYKPMVDQEPYIKAHLNDMDMNDLDRKDIARPWSDETRYGKAYQDYQTSKRHYTKSNSPSDKEAMEAHASEHVGDTITTIREIWKTADPDLRKRMKTDLTNLINEMVV